MLPSKRLQVAIASGGHVGGSLWVGGISPFAELELWRGFMVNELWRGFMVNRGWRTEIQRAGRLRQTSRYGWSVFACRRRPLMNSPRRQRRPDYPSEK